jgi:alkylation response protein AidB-like acyl-CoA dehydrogenase
MRRDLYEPDHEAFREVVQAYVKREVTPNQQRWEQEHIVDRQAWLTAGKQAIIGHLIPERFGGLGTQDFRFRCVVMEEFAKVGATSLSKLWATEVQHRVLDRCLQLFGGYGYMAEYPIARAYADARVQTIYGGTSEIMKTIIARDLTGLRS